MPSTPVAAVDIGASSGRVVVVDLGPDGVVLREIARFPNGPVEREGRWVWDAQALFTHMMDGLAATVPLGVRSFGIDTWAVDYGVVDSRGALIGPVVAYRDPRHAVGVDRLRARLPWSEQYAITGIQDLVINTIYQLAGEDPLRLTEGTTFAMVPDLLGFWATGTMATDVTNASSTGLVDPRTRTWSDALIAAIGAPRSAFLTPDEPGHVRGEALDARCERLELIGVATHDTASAFAGAPIVDRDRALIISLGTWALIGYESTDAVPGPESLALNITHELGVDRTVRVLRNVSGMWLLEECRRGWGEQDGPMPDVPDLVTAMLQAPAFAAGFDIDDPGLTPPGQSPGTIAARLIGSWDGSRGAVVRAILESLVVRLAQRAAELERLGGRPREVINVVGGASRIAPLMQWLADATGKEVVAGPAEATALGNAAVQWQARGVLSGLAEARALIGTLPEVRTYLPQGDRAAWQAFAERIASMRAQEGRDG